jgi:hypothetical protein
MRTKSLKKINQRNHSWMFQNIYDSREWGSTPCERKDVAHEAPAAEETLLSLTPAALLIMPKQNQ